MEKSSNTQIQRMTKLKIKSIFLKKREDHISKLSNEIIINEILYRLPTSKDMIRTGTLSKRFKNLWRSVPKIVFNDYQFHEINYDFDSLPYFDVDNTVTEFYKSVNETLTQLQLKTLDDFDFKAHYGSQFSQIVHEFVDFVCSRNVKRFSLDLKNSEDDCKYWIFPNSFYINKHFTGMNLRHCVIYPFMKFTWNNLVNLSIGDSQIDESLMVNILNGSPLLKSLTFEYCVASILDIQSTSLENFQLIGFGSDEIDSDYIAINAPNIMSLKIVGKMYLMDILLKDVSSLKVASLDFLIQRNVDIHKREQENVLKSVIERLQHVECIQIGYSCNKVKKSLFIFCYCYFFISISADQQILIKFFILIGSLSS